MKRYIPIISLLAAMFLASCAGTPAPVTGTTTGPVSGIQGLASFTVADLQAASADAHAQVPPDQTAYQCYDYLASVIPTIQLPAGMSTVGAFVAFQKARDVANGVSGIQGQLKTLNLACAPLVIDTQTTINKLLLLGAGAAATGGATVFVPFVPIQ